MSWINPVWSLLIVGYLSAKPPRGPTCGCRACVCVSISPITFDMKKEDEIIHVYSYIAYEKNARTVWSYIGLAACFRRARCFHSSASCGSLSPRSDDDWQKTEGFSIHVAYLREKCVSGFSEHAAGTGQAV